MGGRIRHIPSRAGSCERPQGRKRRSSDCWTTAQLRVADKILERLANQQVNAGQPLMWMGDLRLALMAKRNAVAAAREFVASSKPAYLACGRHL